MLVAILRWFTQLSKGTVIVILVLACALVGALDFVSPPEVALTAPYLAIISFAVWYGGRFHGYAVGTFGIITRFISAQQLLHNRPYLSAWNVVLEALVLLGAATIIFQFKSALEHEKAFSRKDLLTGLLSRRGFDEVVERELNRSKRYKTPICVALMDVDKFKRVNDVQGHKAGDMLLRGLGQCLTKAVRNVDAVARWGGDEFILLMPDTSLKDAELAVARVKEELALFFQLWGIGLSIGVSEIGPKGIDQALHDADVKMYNLKKLSRQGSNLRPPS